MLRLVSVTLGFKWSSCLVLLKCWDYKCEPLCPAKFQYSFLLFFWDGVFLSPRLEWSHTITAHCSLDHLGSFDLPTSASWVAGTTGVCHHAQLILFVLVETGFHHVDQDVLDLLTLWSTRLGLPKCWDYRREPPRPAGTWFWISIESTADRTSSEIYCGCANPP